MPIPNWTSVQTISTFIVYIPPNNVSDKFNRIRDICKFLQPGFISPRSFKENLKLPTTNCNDIYKSIIQLISNDLIHILKSKTSQEFLLKVFYYNNRGIKKVKKLQKLSNKEIYFTLQNNSKNYKKPFRFIAWTNNFKDHSVFTPKTWGKMEQNFYWLV